MPAPAPLPTDIFLRKKFYFLVTLAVLYTTVFSLFNLNSYCIILLGACRLWEGRILENIRKAFTNSLFLAYFLFFVVEVAGMLHTHNMKAGADVIAKDATFVAIAFSLLAGRFADERAFGSLMLSYCAMVLAASVYCLVIAAHLYMQGSDASVFFYHPLTSPISWNAVFFSVYVLFALIFLLSADGYESMGVLPSALRVGVRGFLVVFNMGMIFLLSSKLILVLSVIVLIGFFLRRYRFRENRRIALAFGLGILVLLGILAGTNNPVRERYQELAQGDLKLVGQKKFAPGNYFNALQVRLLEYRFAREVLRERNAWLFGVGPGDSQDLLDQKYIDANMYIGDTSQGPHRKIRGYIGYNYHNQYVETLVRDGILGLVVLLAIFGLLVSQLVRRWRTRQVSFTILTLALFFVPEAPLTLQHGIFLFCFFPLVLFGSRRATHPPDRLSGNGTAAG
jgi:O-antigen ligase